MTKRRHEDGSILVMALVMLTAIGLLVGAALNYAGASLRSSNVVYRPTRMKVYDADSAIQTAIQYVKNNPAIGQDVVACPSSTFAYTGASGPVSVDLCPQTDSFINDGDFRAVLLTLAGPSSGEGMQFSKNKDVSVNGNVWSNSTISAGTSGSITVNGGRLWSWNTNSCTGIITSPGGKDCNAHTTFNNVVPKVGLDPGDPSLGHSSEWQPAAAPGAVQTPSGCTLQPGVYMHGDDLTALNTCATLTLAPGVFYLDFAPAGTSGSKSATDDTWSIGTAVTGAACQADGQGTQLVFANASQMRFLASGTFTVPCGRRSAANGPLIGVTGLKTSTGVGANTSTVLRPTAAATQAGDNLFTPATLGNVVPTAAPGYPQDGTNVTATPAAKNKNAILNIGSVSPPAGQSIPANALITSAVVKVGHDETSNTSFPANSTQLNWGGCTVNLAPTNPTPGVATLFSADVTSQLSSCAAFDPSQPAQVVWNVQTTSTALGRIDVDGAQLEVTWHDPGIISQYGPDSLPNTSDDRCVVKLLSAGGCALLDSPTNGHDTFDIEGVVYAPGNALLGTYKNGGAFTVRDALVVRSVNVDTNPAAVGQPIVGGGTNHIKGGKVRFTAKIGGVTWTDTYVTYDDQNNFATTINSWVIKP